MFDFGDELTIESYKAPWLLWIQILVLFLLIMLLYGFFNFALDLSEDAAAASPSYQKPLFKHNSTVTSCLQVGGSQSIKGEIATSTSRGVFRLEETTEREGSPSTNVTQSSILHPCYYFRLARTAFLKCLGLDSASDSSSTTEHRKES